MASKKKHLNPGCKIYRLNKNMYYEIVLKVNDNKKTGRSGNKVTLHTDANVEHVASLP